MPEYAVALGTFDGLHSGHKAVLQNILKNGYIPLALTFDLPPKTNKKTNLLMLPEDKISGLNKLGIKAEIMDFEKVKDISDVDFLSFIKNKFSPKIITTGYDFRFGKGATGDTSLLAEFCKTNNISYICTDAVTVDSIPVSSTRIRQLISSGEIKKANQMLGFSFSFSGEVNHGDERGRTIGFPTVNVAYPIELVTPKFGVYASLTEIDGKLYKSVTDIGVRPTFKTDYVISETNIMNFKGDLYEKTVRIHLVDFIREERKFSGINELKEAIFNDKKAAEEILNKGE
jgi:riboflavin kinase/FMN adenylyltransferase